MQTDLRDPVWFVKVGKIVGKIHSREGGRKRGQAVLINLAEDVDEECTALLLYRSRSVAAVFEENEVREWQRAMQKAGGRLTGRHLWRLASVADAKTRKGLLQKCVRRGWSAQELDRQIYDRLGSRRPNAGGQPRAPATDSPVLAVRQLTRLVRRLRIYGNAWLKGDKAVLRQSAARAKADLVREVQMALLEVPEALKALQKFRKYLRSIDQEGSSGADRKRSKGR